MRKDVDPAPRPLSVRPASIAAGSITILVCLAQAADFAPLESLRAYGASLLLGPGGPPVGEADLSELAVLAGGGAVLTAVWTWTRPLAALATTVALTALWVAASSYLALSNGVRLDPLLNPLLWHLVTAAGAVAVASELWIERARLLGALERRSRLMETENRAKSRALAALAEAGLRGVDAIEAGSPSSTPAVSGRAAGARGLPEVDRLRKLSEAALATAVVTEGARLNRRPTPLMDVVLDARRIALRAAPPGAAPILVSGSRSATAEADPGYLVEAVLAMFAEALGQAADGDSVRANWGADAREAWIKVSPFATARSEGDGMALGLRLARAVADAHGGRLETEPDAVRLRLPLGST